MKIRSKPKGRHHEVTPDLDRLLDLIAERVAQRLVEDHLMKSKQPQNSLSKVSHQSGSQPPILKKGTKNVDKMAHGRHRLEANG